MKYAKLIFLPLLILTSCEEIKYHTPLEYCYWEVCSNYESYYKTFDAPYSYKEIHATYDLDSEWYEDRNVKAVYNYEITIYDEEKLDVWFCSIAFNCDYRTFLPKHCVDIDCDWIYSIPYETTLVGVE